MGVRVVTLVLAALAAVGASVSSSTSGWRSGPVYEYTVRTRTLAGMDSAPAQFAGVFTRAHLELQVDDGDPSQLNAQIEDAHFSPLRAELPGGWDTPAPKAALSWRPLPLRHTNFALRMRQGEIKELLVKESTSPWEVNFFRGVVSAFQVVVGGDAILKSRRSQPPNPNATSALYSVKEKLPLGECVVKYDVSPLPAFVVTSQAHLAPAVDLRRNHTFVDIVKTVNFERCKQPPLYMWGSGGSGSGGDGPVTRSASARVIAVGRLGRMEVHSSVWSSRMSAGPLLRGDDTQAAAWARVNVTLMRVQEQPKSRVPAPTNTRATSLVFDPTNPAQQHWSSSKLTSQNPRPILRDRDLTSRDDVNPIQQEFESNTAREGKLQLRDLPMMHIPRIGPFSGYRSGYYPYMRTSDDDIRLPPRAMWELPMDSVVEHQFPYQGIAYGQPRNLDDIPVPNWNDPQEQGPFEESDQRRDWANQNGAGPARPIPYAMSYQYVAPNQNYADRGQHARILKRHYGAQMGSHPEPRLVNNEDDIEKLLNYLADMYPGAETPKGNGQYLDEINSPRYKRVDFTTKKVIRSMNDPPFSPPPFDDTSSTHGHIENDSSLRNSFFHPPAGRAEGYDSPTSSEANSRLNIPRSQHKENDDTNNAQSSHSPKQRLETLNSKMHSLNIPAPNNEKYAVEAPLSNPHGVLRYIYRHVWARKTPKYARNVDTTTEDKSNWWKDRMERIKQWFKCPKPFVKECTALPRSVPEGDKLDSRPTLVDPDELRRRELLDQEAMAEIMYDPEYYGVKHLCPVSDILGSINEIAKELKDLGSLVEHKTLLKFGDLVRVIRSCKHTELLKMADMIPEKEPEEQLVTAWKVLRDACAHAGTGPALVAVREWLGRGRLASWEARQVLASLPAAARAPTPRYLQYFFLRLVSDPEVVKMEGEKVAAVLAFSTLVRGAHARGLRVDGYVAYLARRLGEATSNIDTHDIQVMIRALGKTGHPLVLQAFRPYLNGLVPHSTIFQRMAMVVALQKVAVLHPSMARSVLFNVFRSRGEAVEVRIAALYILLSARPSQALLRRVAEEAYANNIQLESAVVSALHSAAQLKSPAAKELAKGARFALASLPRRSRGIHRSRCLMHERLPKHRLGPGYSCVLNYIGSRDEIVPQMLYVGSSGRMGGLNLGTTQFAMMVSSMNKLLTTLENDNHKDEFVEPSFMKEQNYVNLGPRVDEPLEGHMLFPLAGAQHFITFDKKSIIQSTWDLMMGVVNLVLGKDVHMSKMYFGPRYSYAAPDITGHLNFFTFDAPSALRTVGNIKDVMKQVKVNVTNGKIDKALLTGFHVNMNLTWALAMRGRVGFVCPFDAHELRFVAAFDQQTAFALPLDATLGALSQEDDSMSRYVMHMEPKNEGKEMLMHFKSTPFTAVQSAELQDNDSEQLIDIISSQPLQKWVWNFGPHNLMRLNVTAEIEFLNTEQMRRDHAGYDFWSLFTLPMVHTTTHNAEVTLSVDLKKAMVDSIVVPVRFSGDDILDLYDLEEEQYKEGELKAEKDTSHHKSEKHPGDREYNVETGIMTFFKDRLTSHIIKSEYSNNFVGNYQNYTLKYFYVDSPYKNGLSESNKIHHEMTLHLFNHWGDSPLWFFEQALTSNPTTYVTAKMEYVGAHQPKMHIDLKCEMSRTAERVSFLRGVGEARVCQKQMEEGNMFLPACANVTLRAGHLDRYECEAKFEHLTPAIQKAAATTLGFVLGATHAQWSEDSLYRGPAGRATLEVQYQPSFHGASVRLRTPSLALDVTEVANTRNARPWLVLHPALSVRKRVAQYLFNYQDEPFCVLDKNAVNTFDNTTYPIELGACWYNVSTLQERGKAPENITLQARDNGVTRILRIVFSLGSQLEVRDDTKNARFKRNHHASDYSGYLTLDGVARHITRNEPLIITLKHGNYVELVEVSMIAENLYELNLKLHRIRILFDGVRVIVFAPNSFRARSQGLCGTFTGELMDDFLDPDGFIQSDPKLFAASFANVNDNCQGSVKEEHERSKKVPRFEEDIILDDVVGDTWKIRGEQKKRTMPCKMVAEIDVIVNGTHHCFSQKSLQSCGNCKPVGGTKQRVNYHCISGSMGTHWKSMVEKGGKPDFSHKKTHAVFEKEVPTNCRSS